MFTATRDQMLHCPPRPFDMERRWKSNVEQAPNCPRCASTNTKFCYYNNYSLSQPRFFCKACRRYWTKGGSLRNVPAGGGCRKNRRPRSARSSQPELVGPSYLRNPPSPGRSSNDPFTVSPGRSDGSSDIDLAAVYAKFLNQNSGSENTIVGEDQPSSSATTSFDLPVQRSALDVETLMENFIIEPQKPCDLIDEARLPDGLMGEDPTVFELQTTMLGDDELLQQEMSWNFSWQPMVELEEMGSFLGDDQLKVSSNLISDNWSTYDILGSEIFSRP